MRSFYITLVLALCLNIHNVHSQKSDQPTFSVKLKEVELPHMPGVHSFAHGQYAGKWIIIGGRTDGLHMRQPWASFWAAYNNPHIYIIDMQNKQVDSVSLAGLPGALKEQLQSTNMLFYQDGSSLHIAGGYGYSAAAEDWVTHPYLTTIDLKSLIIQVRKNGGIKGCFTYLTDPFFRLTGGSMYKLGERFYLVGGQEFMGRYNPMGPDHGPGFTQTYLDGYRSFRLYEEAGEVFIENKRLVQDSNAMHRRDLNVVPLNLPDGKQVLAMFSGVFRTNVDLPWTNVVFIEGTENFQVVPEFTQYFSHYHSANAPVFDVNTKSMHTFFFGGIAQYYQDGKGNLVKDDEVPFVKTISVVSISSDTIEEQAIDKMPGYLGASAAFIPNPELKRTDHGVILLEPGSEYPLLLGHVIGGLETETPNHFFTNTGSESWASKRVFEVYLKRK